MKLETILPAAIGALVAFVLYDMFIKDMVKPKAFDADL